MNIFAKHCTFLNLRSHVVTQMTLQFSTNRRESPIKGKTNALQNYLWYTQLCQREMHWCWFYCHSRYFPPFDSSVISFIPPSLFPPTPSPSSPLSLCSEPSTVKMDPSKLCLKPGGSIYVHMRFYLSEGGRESHPIQYEEQPPQQWMMVLWWRRQKKTGQMQDLWHTFKPPRSRLHRRISSNL